jgi:Xaa-Pro aminopeptidase
MSDEATPTIADDAPLPMPDLDGDSPSSATSHSTLAVEPSPLKTRKDEIEAKQKQIAKMLAESQTDAVLLFDPPNLAWLTGASICQGIPDPNDWPAIYLTSEQRWLLSGSADTQRIFDAHLDGLGFQLKEWPWHWGREQLLASIVQNRKMACDRVLANSTPLGPTFRRIRLPLTAPERDRFKSLGAAVAHALEATCRNIEIGQTEQEVAGEVAHRLIKHGIMPVTLSVAADGRARRHRRPAVTDKRIERECVIFATAQRHGLHVTAARTVLFQQTDGERPTHHVAAARIAAALAFAARPRTSVADVLEAGRAVAEREDKEAEWFRGPTGNVTGWLPLERPIAPTLTYPFDADWAVVWQAGISSALVADTWLIADQPTCVTRPEKWPIHRITIGGQSLDLPDVLTRRG